MKAALLFPGQGAQHAGMGRDIAEAYPPAAEIFSRADQILGFELSKLCFEGPPEKLDTTEISQPAIFTTSAAILEALEASPDATKIRPDVTAGLSLGEYRALYAAGMISFEDGLVVTAARGRAMQAAAEASEGGMLGIIGLDEEKVEQICRQASEGEILEAVNFNCPGQVVISGAKSACKRAEKLADEYGAVKAVPLAVAGAFHTDMMAPAAEKLRQALEQCQITEPADIKTIANIDAQYYDSADKIRESLTKQLTTPLLWQKCMERLIADGVESFYEIGPGRVLTGLMRRINRKIKVVTLGTADAIGALVDHS